MSCFLTVRVFHEISDLNQTGRGSHFFKRAKNLPRFVPTNYVPVDNAQITSPQIKVIFDSELMHKAS